MKDLQINNAEKIFLGLVTPYFTDKKRSAENTMRTALHNINNVRATSGAWLFLTAGIHVKPENILNRQDSWDVILELSLFLSPTVSEDICSTDGSSSLTSEGKIHLLFNQQVLDVVICRVQSYISLKASIYLRVNIS